MQYTKEAVRIVTYNNIKGGLISESFSLWLKSPKKKVTTHSPEHILFKLIWNFFLRVKVKANFATKIGLHFVQKSKNSVFALKLD